MSYKGLPYRGPYAGIIDSPGPNNPPNAFDDVLNFFCRKSRIQSRPKFNNFGATPDNAIIRNMLSFSDLLLSNHTLVLTTKNAYFLTSGPTYNVLTYPGGITNLEGTALPYGTTRIINRVYFANGSVTGLYTDGESSVKVAGDIPGSFRFAVTLASHVVIAYTTEPAPGADGSQRFPRRVRWSASGLPDDWTGFSSGFNDLEEVPDEITGLAALGRNGFIFRTNGITGMYPTGIGAIPFRFEHFSYSDRGVGNVHPYSLAVYGDVAVFVASDDIYYLTGGTLTRIAGNSKKKIFADLDQASGDQIVGFIIPKMGAGFDFLSYWLSIPGKDVTWVYHYDEQNWVRVTSAAGRLTFCNTVTVS